MRETASPTHADQHKEGEGLNENERQEPERLGSFHVSFQTYPNFELNRGDTS